MNDYSMAIVVGRLVAEPEMSSNGDGTLTYVFLHLDVRRNTETSRVIVKAEGRLAEMCGQLLKKGRAVMVVGSITSSGGALHVKADRVQFLGEKDQKAAAAQVETAKT